MALTKHYPILTSVLSDTPTGASKYVCCTRRVLSEPGAGESGDVRGESGGVGAAGGAARRA